MDNEVLLPIIYTTTNSTPLFFSPTVILNIPPSLYSPFHVSPKSPICYASLPLFRQASICLSFKRSDHKDPYTKVIIQSCVNIDRPYYKNIRRMPSQILFNNLTMYRVKNGLLGRNLLSQTSTFLFWSRKCSGTLTQTRVRESTHNLYLHLYYCIHKYIFIQSSRYPFYIWPSLPVL